MKQGMKRLLVALLAALMLLGVSPFGVLAAETESAGESVIESAGEELTLPEEPVETATPEETETEAPDEPETETAAETDETAASGETDPAETEDEAEAAAVSLTADSELSLDAAAVDGRVHVIVENTTYTTDAPWDGVLVDTWLNLSADSTMMSCIVAAVKDAGYEIEVAESSYGAYINAVNGLTSGSGGDWAGWTGTLNDWFTSSGFGAYSVENGTLLANDEIRVMYSLNGGADVGNDWNSTDTTLTALDVSVGTLSPAFASATQGYTLTLPAGTTVVRLTPTAANKSNRVKISVGETEYRRTETIPVEDGTVITLDCAGTVYTLTVKIGEKSQTANVTIRAQMNGGYLCGFEEVQTVPSTLAEDYGYADSVDGVSALDALVRAHERIFGEGFTKDTATTLLAVNGYVTAIFGEQTYNNGFFLNEGYPNDGTPSAWGGYNGTTVATQEIVDGDVLDFFVYRDSWCMDYYTWVTAPSTVAAEQSFTAVVTGVSAMMGYLYSTPAAMKAAAEPLADAGLAWVDAVTGAATEIEDAAADGNGLVTVTAPKTPGRYYLTATGDEAGDFYSPVLMNPCVVTVTNVKPTVITVEYAGSQMLDGQLIGKQGDSFPFRAVDENGVETPVTWSFAGESELGTLDTNTGVFTVTGELVSGDVKTLRLTATSTLDSGKTAEAGFELIGYVFDSDALDTVVDLPDGDAAASLRLTGGVDGRSVWSWDIPNGVASVAGEPGRGNEIQLSCLSTGVIKVTVAVEGFEDTLYSTATVTVRGTDEQMRLRIEALIKAIGTVDATSGEKIAAARSAYEALTDEQKALVSNYDVLKAAEASYGALVYQKSYSETTGYLAGQGTPGVGSIGGEWAVISLTRSGNTVGGGYYVAALEYALENSANNRLDANRATENARLILALTAAGYDPTQLAGFDLTAGLNDMKYIQKQGINGPVWTLIALDSHNWPVSGDVTREKLVQAILDAACAGGGWTFYGNTADPDMTGMALTALAPYYKKGDTKVTAAVDKALDVLSDMQSADGGFGSSESCAQVITALTALDIDPATDARFVKQGKNALDALCSFAVEGGGFAHSAGGARDQMATEQGAYALAAYYRFKNGKTSLYDMSDVTLDANAAVSYVESLIDAIGTVDGSSGSAIAAARRVYNALSAAQKAQVKNYAALTAAERRLASLDPQGGTKTIGSGSTKLVLDGVTYMVDAEAAALMKRIAALRDNGGTDDDGILEAYKTYDAMSSKLKAQVFNYDDLEALCTALGVRGHHDSKTGMKAEGLPWYVLLEVEALDSGSEHETVAGSIGSNRLAGLWRVGFIDRLTGEAFTPYEDVTLRVTAPAHEGFEELRIARLGDDGRVSYSECSVTGGELVFTVPETGVYGFIGGAAEANEMLPANELEEAESEEAAAPALDAEPVETAVEPEAQHSLLWLWIAIGAAAAVVLVVAIVLKKRDRQYSK